MRHGRVAISSLVLALVACSDASTAPEVVRVGAVDGSDVLVAVVERGGRFRAYACGATASAPRVAQWFDGVLGDAPAVVSKAGLTLSLERRPDGKLRGALSGATVSGAFDAESVRSPGAGLWRGAGQYCTTGLIVADDGSTRGAYCTTPSDRVQVVPITPPTSPAESVDVFLGPREAGQRANVVRVQLDP